MPYRDIGGEATFHVFFSVVIFRRVSVVVGGGFDCKVRFVGVGVGVGVGVKVCNA